MNLVKTKKYLRLVMADSDLSEVVIKLKEKAAIELRDKLDLLLRKYCHDCKYFRSKFVTQGNTCWKKGINVRGDNYACNDDFESTKQFMKQKIQ